MSSLGLDIKIFLLLMASTFILIYPLQHALFMEGLDLNEHENFANNFDNKFGECINNIPSPINEDNTKGESYKNQEYRPLVCDFSSIIHDSRLRMYPCLSDIELVANLRLNNVRNMLITYESTVLPLEDECGSSVREYKQGSTLELGCSRNVIISDNTTVTFEYTSGSNMDMKTGYIACSQVLMHVITGKGQIFFGQ